MRVLQILLTILLIVNVGCSQPPSNKNIQVDSEFKMNDKMDDIEFWKIMDYSFAVASGDKRKQEEIIIKKLSAYSPEQIVEFEILLCEKLIEANDFKVMAAEKIIDGSVTDDTYLYFRCWLISRGKTDFINTLRQPEYLASVVEKGIETDFEGLLYVSTEAYKNKTGKKVEDDTFPRNVASDKGLNYDFGGPKTTGTDWKEEELPKLYPKLWAKFN